MEQINYWIVPGIDKLPDYDTQFAKSLVEKIEEKIQDKITKIKRDRLLVEGRQVLCYVLRNKTKLTTNEIGKFINKDHSTVIYAAKHVEDLLCVDETFKNNWKEILNFQIN
ncbi:MAG: hypothetical protein MJ198_10675 [Bacteroidales bacterium]|nr:hypothetical protein [Bacteroidales bacterium]